MQVSTIITTLHVILAFAAVAFLVVPGAMLEKAAETRDVPYIRRAFALGVFHGRIGGPIVVLAAAVGIAAAWGAGIPLTSGWLIAAYISFAIGIGLGIGYHSRREMRILALAQASPDDAPSPELAAVIADPLARPMLWISTLNWLFIIWDMVAKPF
jgi:hypothetical protein